MEKKLRALFDYQAFENNISLKQLIDAVHVRCAARTASQGTMELSLDDMSRLAAAGTIRPEKKEL